MRTVQCIWDMRGKEMKRLRMHRQTGVTWIDGDGVLW
jgi:hypothetical protein